MDPDLKINRDILWTTVIFGALALVFSIISIVVTFYLSWRERRERSKQAILANVEYLLKNLKASFDDIGQSIFNKNNLGLKRAIDSFDIYATLTLDELNPKTFAASHSRMDFTTYRKAMEEMMQNSLPLALDRYGALLTMSKDQLKLPQNKGNRMLSQYLNDNLKQYSEKLAKKQRLLATLKNNPKQKWIYTQQELADFRKLLESIWLTLFEGFKQHQKELGENNSSAWSAMDTLYNEQETKFHQFRGTLQSLFFN